MHHPWLLRASLLVAGMVAGAGFVALWGFSATGEAHHSFSSVSGFAKAKNEPRLSILVWAHPATSVNVAEVIRPWNALAGWPLFEQVTDSNRADVRFVPDSATWVEAQPSYSLAFEQCIIHSATANTKTLRHEIGHCLGFADHVLAVNYGNPGWINPKVCDQRSHPAYWRYRGVMSYCDWNSESRWFAADDQRMMQEASYVGSAATPPVEPAPTPCRWRVWACSR